MTRSTLFLSIAVFICSFAVTNADKFVPTCGIPYEGNTETKFECPTGKSYDISSDDLRLHDDHPSVDDVAMCCVANIVLTCGFVYNGAVDEQFECPPGKSYDESRASWLLHADNQTSLMPSESKNLCCTSHTATPTATPTASSTVVPIFVPTCGIPYEGNTEKTFGDQDCPAGKSYNISSADLPLDDDHPSVDDIAICCVANIVPTCGIPSEGNTEKKFECPTGKIYDESRASLLLQADDPSGDIAICCIDACPTTSYHADTHTRLPNQGGYTCDTLWENYGEEFGTKINCETLTSYGWDCSGCTCQ